MGAGSLREWRTVARASQLETAAGTSSCCRSPFPAILTVVALLFSSPHWRRQPKPRVPGHNPRLQKETKVLEDTTGSRLGRDAPLRCRQTRRTGWGMAPIVFRLLFTMRVVADRTCNYSPRVSAKMTGGRAQQRKRM